MFVTEREFQGYVLKSLVASEGMYITDGKYYSKSFDLALGTDVSCYRDATPEEYEASKNIQEEVFEG